MMIVFESAMVSVAGEEACGRAKLRHLRAVAEDNERKHVHDKLNNWTEQLHGTTGTTGTTENVSEQLDPVVPLLLM